MASVSRGSDPSPHCAGMLEGRGTDYHTDPDGVSSHHSDIHKNKRTPNACHAWIVLLCDFLEKPEPPGPSLWSPKEATGSHHGDFQDSGVDTRETKLGCSHSVSLEKEETGQKQTLSTGAGA